MDTKFHESRLLEWLKDKPDLLEKLDQMRRLEQGGGDLDAMELELLELVKGLGADSYRRVLEQKEGAAMARQQTEGGGRMHGKKN